MWAPFRQLFKIFAKKACSKTFDFYQFLLSFCSTIVRAFASFWPRKFRWAAARGCWTSSRTIHGVISNFLRNAPNMITLNFGIIVCRCETSGRDFCFLICLFMFPRYYFRICSSRPSGRIDVTMLSVAVWIFSIIWSFLPLRFVGHSELCCLCNWDALIVVSQFQDVVNAETGLYDIHKLKHGVRFRRYGESLFDRVRFWMMLLHFFTINEVELKSSRKIWSIFKMLKDGPLLQREPQWLETRLIMYTSNISNIP